MPQRVLITAGAAGIGREFARAFAATDATVFVCDIEEQALAAIAKELPGLIVRRCDMAVRADIERMVPDAVAALGGLDVLINNAGIAGLTLPVDQTPPTRGTRWSPSTLPRCSTSPGWRSASEAVEGGVIINMSSMAGRFGFKNRSPYAATKWGVIGFTKTLAVELGEWHRADYSRRWGPFCGGWPTS